ncbi:MAG: hypothetical protein LKG53_05010 [Lachnospiraceae bacterium]|jgi:hypothetical protein|nr:hypothetical protein [Lachnospiraceae bacterium]
MMEKPWETEYYHELQADKRQKLLDEAIAVEGMSPENELRKKLLEARYGKSLGRGRKVDYFIRGWMTLKMIAGNTRNRKRTARDIRSVMDDWKFELAGQYGEAGNRILYQEFCNMALVYIDLCKKDRTYGAVILGIGRISDDSLTMKIARDIYSTAYDIPDEAGIRDDLRLFTEAATAMVCEALPGVGDDFMEMVSQRK